MNTETRDAALEKQLEILAQKHAKAVAELDETEEENIKLITALRDIRRAVAEAKGDKQFLEVSSEIMEIVSKHIK